MKKSELLLQNDDLRKKIKWLEVEKDILKNDIQIYLSKNKQNNIIIEGLKKEKLKDTETINRLREQLSVSGNLSILDNSLDIMRENLRLKKKVSELEDTLKSANFNLKERKNTENNLVKRILEKNSEIIKLEEKVEELEKVINAVKECPYFIFV